MSFDPKALKRKISDLRLRSGITQKTVAIESGVSDYLLSLILSGKRKGYKHRLKILSAIERLEGKR